MYSSVPEYLTTMNFVTINKTMWEQVFLDDKHHQSRKDIGVTYCSYSSNRNDVSNMTVSLKFDNLENMEKHRQKIDKLLEENTEKWKNLGDLNSIEFNHWKFLCECTNDINFENFVNKTDDIFWIAKHTVDDKKKWVNSLKSQQDSGINNFIRWWGLMENINKPNEVSCIYRIPKDKLLDFVLNFTETINKFNNLTTVDVNTCDINFTNIEWETMYSKPISFRQLAHEDKLKNIIEELSSLEGGRQHMDDSCVFVRPTGNPLDMKQWDEMMNSDDVKIVESKLLKINKLEVIDNMAYACYTSHTKFNFKGTENDDIAVFTGIFKNYDEVWKMVFGQRSTGRKPADALPKF